MITQILIEMKQLVMDCNKIINMQKCLIQFFMIKNTTEMFNN